MGETRLVDRPTSVEATHWGKGSLSCVKRCFEKTVLYLVPGTMRKGSPDEVTLNE